MLIDHPGRAFVRPALAGKAWAYPLAIRVAPRGGFALVDGRGAVVLRFRRFRYAYAALEYLSKLNGKELLSYQGAREDCRRAYSKAQRERNARLEASRARSNAKDRAQLSARVRLRREIADAFWSRFKDQSARAGQGRPKHKHVAANPAVTPRMIRRREEAQRCPRCGQLRNWCLDCD